VPATDARSHPSVAVRRLGVLVAGCLAVVGSCAIAATAQGASATKTVSYRGYQLTVPAGWPVYRLAERSGTCVRFNRHAVYLGVPSADQSCPAHAAGRTEAILVSPLPADVAGAARTNGLPDPAAVQPAIPEGGSSAQLPEPSHHVVVTATWGRQPAVIRQALGVRSLPSAGGSPHAVAAAATNAMRRSPSIRAATAVTAASQPGEVYTGLGFDACATPSSSQMSAWDASGYRAIGIYIGGTNMACAQPNLNSAWVSSQSAAGWHLIPIYVGLQAPSNSCGCAAISAAGASGQGTAAARDAVVQAQAVGLGAGNPVYFDMEGYNQSSTTSSAVLAFLAAWTSQLHAQGYKSGVYSSAASGIRDLVGQTGAGYSEPDDIWIANWNGTRSTVDVNVPSGDWPAHQRLHQYSGAHNETHGGTTINVDGDYVDAATAAAGTVTTAAAAGPSLSVAPVPDGSIDLYPSWRGVSGVSSWQVLAGPTATALSPAARPVGATTRLPIALRSAYPYFQIRALSSTGLTLGVSPAVATPAHVSVIGNEVFVPRHGPAAVPVSCFQISACQVTMTIATTTTLARTATQRIPAGGGLAYFRLSPSGHALVAEAGHRRLPVTVTVRTSTGKTATRRVNLVPYTTSGPSPQRRIGASTVVRILSATEFLSNGWSGGMLASCLTAIPCSATTTISAGGQVIARTGAESLGASAIGYLRFRLTAAGHRMLARSRGNQLSTRVDITSAGTTASAAIVLSMFH
jgi:glycoside hydrolase-like protein